MKHLMLVAALTTSLALPIVAQTVVGGPIELRNPHRRGGDAPATTEGVAPVAPFVGGGGSYWGGSVPSTFQMPVVAPPPTPAVAMFADGPYLFVLRGDSLFQFDKKTLKLINSTELPRPVAPNPTPAASQEELRTQTSPSLRPGPSLKSNGAR